MSSVVPDQILETYVCRLCDRYLTVGPIKAHPEGGNICGRCHTSCKSCLFECDSTLDLSEQVNIPYAIFGYINHLFPCINRYEGCTKLLSFEEVKNHEKVCQTKTIKCQNCKSYEGNGSQQLNHFRTLHPLNFFDKVYFRFPLNSRYLTNLVKASRCLFFVYVEIERSKQNIHFYVKPTSQCLDEDVEFFCLLKDSDDGEIVDQSTLTRRALDGIYHRLHLKNGQYLEQSTLLCECVLRKVSKNRLKIK